MEIFEATQKGPLRMPGFIDPNDVTFIKAYYGAPTFVVNTVYREGDVCRPSVDNGYYYQCSTNGKSDATEPATWGQSSQSSGTAVFSAVPYDLFLLPGETITSSSWAATDKADVLLLGTEYALGETCRPTIYNGYYYECTIAGNVGGTEPSSWSTTEQVIGDSTFKAVPHVVLDNSMFDSITTSIDIVSIPKGLTEVILTNHVVKSTGEERDKSLKFKVREQ